MGRANKQAEIDDTPGAPEWMVTFSDCMTLLLTFFVLLLSFSSFEDDRLFLHLKVIYSKALSSIIPITRIDRDSFLYLPPVQYVAQLDKGSEKLTSVQGAKDGLMKETRPVDFQTGVAFLISSKKIFWAKGTALSPEGRLIMDTVASMLRQSPGRIVISENGPENDKAGENFGLPRAWAVMEYLTKEKKLLSNRFSISADGTLAQGTVTSTKTGSGRPGSERIVQIHLLQRSIYN
jgi:chemotaxis protein MotB